MEELHDISAVAQQRLNQTDALTQEGHHLA
jgi:hypothetical protein